MNCHQFRDIVRLCEMWYAGWFFVLNFPARKHQLVGTCYFQISNDMVWMSELLNSNALTVVLEGVYHSRFLPHLLPSRSWKL